MVRHAAVPVVVLLAALSAVPRATASQQSDELKQIKADLKLGLAQAKTGTDAALSVFADDIDIILTKLDNGTQSLTTLIDDLGDRILTAVDAIEEANREACNDVSQNVFNHATVAMANATLNGGGGDFDKFHAGQDALQAKALKKMQGILKKFQKSAAKAASTPVAVNILLLPFQSTQTIFASHDATQSDNPVATSSVSVLIGTSSAHAFIGGLSNGLTKPQVQIGGVSTDLTPVSQIWRFAKKTGLSTGNKASFAVTTLNAEAVIGLFTIGVPAAP